MAEKRADRLLFRTSLVTKPLRIMAGEKGADSLKKSELVELQKAILIEPNEELAVEFLAMAKEYQSAGDDRYKAAIENFPVYLEQLSKYARGVNLKPDRVSESEFWLVDRDRIVARSKLRHRLNPALEHEGGHIGYDVRPSERQKGYGTLILKLTLEKATNLDLGKVLLTCDTDNIASAKIIGKNGGEFAGHAVSDKTGKQISRYWIEI
jgi:predicted acetyltransferase